MEVHLRVPYKGYGRPTDKDGNARDWQAACGYGYYLADMPQSRLVVDDPSKVTCSNCRNTAAFKKALNRKNVVVEEFQKTILSETIEKFPEDKYTCIERDAKTGSAIFTEKIPGSSMPRIFKITVTEMQLTEKRS